jgi:hypothetical protein
MEPDSVITFFDPPLTYASDSQSGGEWGDTNPHAVC